MDEPLVEVGLRLKSPSQLLARLFSPFRSASFTV